jgi:hypoxanthine phosphoribosyltransferase
VAEVLFSREAIAARVAELGAELAAHYRDLRPVVLPVMSGAMFFGADLARAMRPRPEGMVVETIKAKSYEGTSSTGVVRVSPEASEVDVRDRHVLVVEDIVDTGGTLRTLLDRFAAAGAASVRMVALLDKRAGRDCSVEANNPHWSGFVVEDKFVIGYGLDFDGAYREVEYVGVLKPERYKT